MAPNNPARGARRVEKYPVEGPSIPPTRGFGRIGDADFGPSLKTAQIVGDARSSGRIRFDRGHLDICDFEQMCGLSSRRGARIEHAHAGSGIEPRRRKLRTRILNRHLAAFESCELRHRSWL